MTKRNQKTKNEIYLIPVCIVGHQMPNDEVLQLSSNLTNTVNQSLSKNKQSNFM